jgi:hypothetical protein
MTVLAPMQAIQKSQISYLTSKTGRFPLVEAGRAFPSYVHMALATAYPCASRSAGIRYNP